MEARGSEENNGMKKPGIMPAVIGASVLTVLGFGASKDPNVRQNVGDFFADTEEFTPPVGLTKRDKSGWFADVQEAIDSGDVNKASETILKALNRGNNLEAEYIHEKLREKLGDEIYDNLTSHHLVALTSLYAAGSPEGVLVGQDLIKAVSAGDMDAVEEEIVFRSNGKNRVSRQDSNMGRVAVFLNNPNYISPELFDQEVEDVLRSTTLPGYQKVLEVPRIPEGFDMKNINTRSFSGVLRIEPEVGEGIRLELEFGKNIEPGGRGL